jgi:hypothetical protein
MALKPITPSLIKHASEIYTQLAVRAAEVSANGVKMGADPAHLAQLSFKLAAVFEKVEAEVNAENLPKNQDFIVNVSDIADWNK